MDNWQSEWIHGDPNDHENVPTNFDKITVFYDHEGNTMDSPNVSKDDSIESCTGDNIDKSDSNLTKPTFKSILQAKKRLQAFSATKQLKRSSSKDEKTDDLDKSDKTLPKKSKKALYPLDKAQAVVQEIEEIKHKEALEAKQEKKKIDAIMAVAYKTLALKESCRIRSRSPSSEREQQFKKREIKSRNYRRSDSFKRRSLSPENCNKRVGKLVYPRNWTEYKQQGLTFVKDEELKSKIFPKIKHTSHELVAKFITFDGPSPLIEPFKSLALEEKVENVPMSFLRITRSKPTLTYSINNKKNKNSFLTRKQLFHIISRDRRNAIEKLISSASSRCQFQSRTLTSRPWYVKSWKRSADAECKILENSVGLSFLQTYSDEEEENENEDIINSNNMKECEIFLDLETSVKHVTSKHYDKEAEPSTVKQAVSDKGRRELKERETLTPEEKPDVSIKKQKEEIPAKIMSHMKTAKLEQSKKQETPERIIKHRDEVKLEEIKKDQTEIILEEVKTNEKDELNETKKAIRELEEELERRRAIRMEEENEVRKGKKKKKVKKKEVSSESEEEERSSRKKKKTNLKKNKYTSECEESSSDNEKLKKAKKKSRRKRYKVTKKKDKSKKTDSSIKEHKLKKRDEENAGSAKDDPRKKRKSEVEGDFEATRAEDVKKAKKKTNDKNKERTNTEDVEVSKVKKKSLLRQDGENGKKKTKNNQTSDSDLEEIQLFDDNKKLESPKLLNNIEGECTSKPQLKIDKSSSGKLGRRSKERTDRPEGENRKSIESDALTDRRQKDWRKSRHDNEINSDDDMKKKRDFEMKDDRKTKEKPKDRYRSREELKHKTEIEQERKNDKHSAKSNKCETDNKISQNRRNSADVEKKIGYREHEGSRDRRQDGKSQKQRENKCEVESLFLKNEPDWNDLRSKRNKHRHSDRKERSEHFPDEFEGFPLAEIYLSKEIDKDGRRSRDGSKHEIGTPDTEEYRENWEKDSYPIWESEDEAPTKAREKLNSSWESDEEIFERGHHVIKTSRPLHDTLDLEIPLNIKPFKKRENIDPDAELQLLKKQSLSLSEERRQFEIEKLRVKELELKVIKEVEGKAKEDKNLKRRRSKDEVEEVENINKKRDSVRKGCLENERVTLKKGRWDKRISSPKTLDIKLDVVDSSQIKKEIFDDDSSTNVSSTTSVNNSSTVLENEYEEFMKALTSSPKKLQVKNRTKKDDVHSENVCYITGPTTCSKAWVASELADSQNSIQIIDNAVNEVDNQTSTPQPVPQIVTILPKDIPLIPMPLSKEIKPVPVPSPQIEIDKIAKPLINLNLSSNITLDIVSKLTTPPPCSPSTSINCVQTVRVQSPVEQHLGKHALENDEDFMILASPFTETSLDSVRERANEIDDKTPTNKPFVFTSMVLPSKRQLLNNSNLNLGDSDDDERHAKPLKKLEEIMKENKIEIVKGCIDKQVDVEEKKKPEPESEISKDSVKEVKKPERNELACSKTQDKDGRKKRQSPDRHVRKDGSPRRSSHSKREFSPRRRGRESPRHRGHSPKRHSPRRRSPLKRRSPGKRRHSPKSVSPKSRRRSSISPRRKVSPRRNSSPKFRTSPPKKVKSKSPDRHSSSYKLSERSVTNSNKPKSPITITSPLEGLKRSVADSTISDDLLLQPSMNIEEFTQSPVPQFYAKSLESPKRESLDTRINQALGLAKEEPQPIPTTYSNYSYTQFSQQFNKVVEPKSNLIPIQQTFNTVTLHQSKSNFVQVGNMVQILPTEDIPMIREEKVSLSCHVAALPPVVKSEKSQILQVGNMLQIVPADLSPEPPLPSVPKLELVKPIPLPSPPVIVQEKQSAEASMRLKVAERREEREKRRLEREKRRKEKEKRRKEKEKRRQIKLKQRTENMIKRALELEVEGVEEEPEAIPSETPCQWPPLPASAPSIPSKEAGKSILVRMGAKSDCLRIERKKAVQFADGVRPGEGTSPSGGEELSSPPPRKKLPKEKRYKKTKLQKKNQKKKVKVKIIKKCSEIEESDEDDNLPPPSPPPGSPPPHIFPPRIKPQAQPTINNIQPYLPNVVPLQSGHSQQLFRPPQLNIIMHPHHPHHGPPPPPHHHGPPPPPHHHGPPPPPHHHPHHHGPPLPPGPPHFHHGPPPPPPHHHGPPPPPGPHHHHHGPPPPFHR